MKIILNLGNFLLLVSALFGVGFLIRLSADYYQIQAGVHSATFSLLILERSLLFLLPGVLCVIASIILKKHVRKGKE